MNLIPYRYGYTRAALDAFDSLLSSAPFNRSLIKLSICFVNHFSNYMVICSYRLFLACSFDLQDFSIYEKNTSKFFRILRCFFILWALACGVEWSFSQLRKMEFHSTYNHPLCGCASIVIQKNYLSVYNKVVQAIL